MQKISFLMLIVTALSCNKERISGSGPVTTESRTLSEFSMVSTNGSTNVFITQANNYDVKVKAYSNLLPYLETKVSNNKLLIGYKNNTNVRNDNSEAFINMPQLDGLYSNGSADIKVTGNFTSSDFWVSSSGSGDITLPEGTANHLSIEISGSGDVTAPDFITQNSDVKIAGSGNVKVNVSGKLNVTISGSGNVYYNGSPTEINTKISGSGQVIKQ